MNMHKMTPQSEYANIQRYRKIAETTTTNNHHKYTRDMQNITTTGGEFKIYPKALEKAPILSSSSSKQGLVEAGSIVQKL